MIIVVIIIMMMIVVILIVIFIIVIIVIHICHSTIGRHYLSNATCLTRPRLFYVLFVVSRTIIIC